MEFTDLVESRRATRSLAPFTVTEDLVRYLAGRASLAPSCFNKQPWRFVFAYGDSLTAVKGALNTPGNDWGRNASLIIGVAARKEDDCLNKGREYYSFDTGMATAILILVGTDKGLVMHPIAGYDEVKAKAALGVPDDHTVITLVIAGLRSEHIDEKLSESQKASEMTRPARLPLADIARIERW